MWTSWSLPVAPPVLVWISNENRRTISEFELLCRWDLPRDFCYRLRNRRISRVVLSTLRLPWPCCPQEERREQRRRDFKSGRNAPVSSCSTVGASLHNMLYLNVCQLLWLCRPSGSRLERNETRIWNVLPSLDNAVLRTRNLCLVWWFLSRMRHSK